MTRQAHYPGTVRDVPVCSCGWEGKPVGGHRMATAIADQRATAHAIRHGMAFIYGRIIFAEDYDPEVHGPKLEG